MIEKFYVLTVSEVYEVLAPQNGPISVISISAHAGFGKVGHQLTGGNTLAVGNLLFMYYRSLSSKAIENIPAIYWTNSAPVVALFEDKDKAINISKKSNLHCSDPRYVGDSKKVIVEIGDNTKSVYLPFDPSIILFK